MDKTAIHQTYYEHVLGGRKPRMNYPRWRGHIIVKLPMDLILYAQAIQENRPDFIIETGTKFGGSALFFADMLETTGKGMVISVDIKPADQPDHPRVRYITGPSTDAGILDRIREMVQSGTVMASLDSNHSRRHVKRELHYYSRLVTPGQYMVVEDCYARDGGPYPPSEAVEWFLASRKGYSLDPVDEQFLVGVTRSGWVKKL